MQYKGEGLDRRFWIGPTLHGDNVRLSHTYTLRKSNPTVILAIQEGNGNETLVFLDEEQMDELVLAYAWFKQERMKSNG